MGLCPPTLTACQPRGTPVEAESRVGRPRKNGDWLAHPQRDEGQVVTVAGEVNDVIDAYAFTTARTAGR